MDTMTLGRRCIFLLLAATLMVVPIPIRAQTRAASSRDSSLKTESYVDYSLPKLHHAVSELHGLTPDPNQHQLPFLLTRVGQVAEDLFEKMPNLISREQVWQMEHDPAAMSHSEALHTRPPREFNYLILSHETRSHSRTLDEYRSDPQDRPVEAEDPRYPHSHGFAYAWVIFFPSNRSESRFRYLGQQKMDEHGTFVVAFAQNPDLVESPGEVVFQGRWIPVFYQGIAWIEKSTFRIVRLRTDLLVPMPSIQLQRLTAQLHFGDIHVSGAASTLWVPQEVDITSELKDHISSEIHRYSNYRLYAVTTRIVPTIR